ncbi:hypothetical protein cand_009900 [Cryptosporidium andersoni]|uniref:RRM domain-containing protein n=1 Tax=Cryptosporidium andersoni TaxID=117008 RepID=A0A1J4MWQ7_9CRYT|nr:hypothetical protein cand_009900 [Cryptosporidium andersoni]
MAINPAFIPRELHEVYAPDEYDTESSIIACNFPTGTNIEECRNFMSWIGPVIYIANAPSIQKETNFVVVFAAPDFAVKAIQQSQLIYNEGCRIYCRLVDEKPTLWNNIISYFHNVDQQYGTSEQISNFVNDTAAPAVYNTSNKIQVGIKELVNSDLSNQVSKGIANVSKQIKESVESAAETLYPV